MYAGTTLTNTSGKLVGAHQKIDRVAYKGLHELLDIADFPSIKQIVYFEGKRGPDGIKSKSPGDDEPDHIFDPFDPNDTEIVDLITGHYKGLVEQLKKKNTEKAAFEASWLAHAIVDGLTPAHHYPYKKEVARLRKNSDGELPRTLKEKLVMEGDTRKEKMLNNWKMWGARGLWTTHAMFEAGVASIIKPLKLTAGYPTLEELEAARSRGVPELFTATAQQIAMLNMYEKFYRKGWTQKLAKQVRDELAPEIIKTVSLVWALALLESGMGSQK